LFQQQLSLLAGKADPYWEMFESAPLREFLKQANHSVRQSHKTTADSPGRLEQIAGSKGAESN
jgi:hypothetical protein